MIPESRGSGESTEGGEKGKRRVIGRSHPLGECVLGWVYGGRQEAKKGNARPFYVGKVG